MRTRLTGALMVMASAAAMIALRLLETRPPDNHPATAVELLFAAFIVLVGLSGLAMLVEGPALFGPIDRPKRG